MGSREREQAEELEGAEVVKNMTDEPRTFTVDVPAGDLRYPHVYTMDEFPGVSPRYKVVFPWDLLNGLVPDRDMADLRTTAKDGIIQVHASSKFRPEVAAEWSDGHHLRSYDPVDRLVQELARLDARNVRRDLVFKGRRVSLYLTLYEYDFPQVGSGVGLSLKGVTVYL